MSPRIPRLKRGEWKPGLQPDLSFLVMMLLSLEIIVRGFDYLTNDRPDVTASLSVVVSAMPLPVWGILFLISGGTFLFGALYRSFSQLIFGATTAMALYGSLAVGLFLRMAERGWPWDGFRTPLMFIIVSTVFGVYAFSTYLKRDTCQVERRMKEGELNPSVKEE